ncbi:MAG: MmgE/PrpD family protein [Pseudomonadota bacterium]
MSISQDLAELVHGADIEALPSVGLDRARRAIYDCLACVLAGHGADPSRAVQSGMAISGGTGPVPVLGTDLTLAPGPAAFANGTAAHALDFDDNFVPGLTHASAVMVPTLISAASLGQDVTLGDLLAAYCAGLEVQAQIGRRMQPDHYAQGWHSTTTIGAVGAAAAAARLLRANVDEILAAMSIASSTAGGSKLQFGTPLKPAHAGLAARNGVTAACLAKSGLRGQAEFIEGDWGMIDLFGGPKAEPSDIESGRWAIETDGLWVKRFPCCGAAHKALDCIVDLCRQQPLNLDDVAQVTAFLPQMLADNLRFDVPKDASEARFSFSYPAALLIANDHLSLEDFTDREVCRSEIKAHLPKFTRQVVPTHSPTADSVQVEIALRSGRRLSHAVTFVAGSPEKPLDRQAMQRKVEDCLDFGGTADHEYWLSSLLDLGLDADIGDWLSRRPASGSPAVARIAAPTPTEAV